MIRLIIITVALLGLAVADVRAGIDRSTFDRIIDYWTDVEQSMKRVEVLESAIETSAQRGDIDTDTHRRLVEAHGRENDQLSVRQEIFVEMLLRLIDDFEASPHEVGQAFIDEARTRSDRGETKGGLVLLDALEFLEGRAVLDLTPPEELPEELQTNDVAVVQRYIVNYFHAHAAVVEPTGEWDERFLPGIRAAVRFVEADPMWSEGWELRPAGVLTADLFIHLAGRYDQMPQASSFQEETYSFLASLQNLRDRGLYTDELPPPPQPQQPDHQPASASPPANQDVFDSVATPPVYSAPSSSGGSTSAAGAFFRAVRNAVLNEWTDELLAWLSARNAESDSDRAQVYQSKMASFRAVAISDEVHTWPRISGMLVGSILSVPSLILYGIFITLAKPPPWTAFKIGFCLECVEGLMIMWGEYSTMGQLPGGTIGGILVYQAVAGVFVGAIVAFQARKNTR